MDALSQHFDKKIKRSTTVILVKNLPYETREDELRELFERFGPLVRVCLSLPLSLFVLCLFWWKVLSTKGVLELLR